MKYEITIRQLVEYSEEEKRRSGEDRMSLRNGSILPYNYSDVPFHERRVLHAEVTQEEFQAVRNAIIGVLS
jgi:hypothetical protein